MDCLVVPCAALKRIRSNGSRLGYRPLTEDGPFGDEDESPVTVLVGKERRVFQVDPFVLEENPIRVLMETLEAENRESFEVMKMKKKKRAIFVDVDAILFEHMLWLMYNDSSSLFKLNVKEIIDFYSQDY